jgi:hypothetical protein
LAVDVVAREQTISIYFAVGRLELFVFLEIAPQERAVNIPDRATEQ